MCVCVCIGRRGAEKVTIFMVGKSEAQEKSNIFLEDSDGQASAPDKGCHMSRGALAHFSSDLFPGISEHQEAQNLLFLETCSLLI